MLHENEMRFITPYYTVLILALASGWFPEEVFSALPWPFSGRILGDLCREVVCAMEMPGFGKPDIEVLS